MTAVTTCAHCDAPLRPSGSRPIDPTAPCFCSLQACRAAYKRHRYHFGKGKSEYVAYYQANAEVIREAARRRRADNVEQALEREARNRDKHRATLNEKARLRYYADREGQNARSAEWRQRNPDRKALYKLERRARIAGTDRRQFTEQDWRRLCARWQNRCAYCGAIGEMTRDHVIPLIRGGRHAVGNILPACMTCNQSKHTKFLVAWKRDLALLGG